MILEIYVSTVKSGFSLDFFVEIVKFMPGWGIV